MGFTPIDNLKLITKKLEWDFICNLKSNRKVSVYQGTYIPIADLELAEKQVRKVWLKEFGFILACKIVDKDGDITYLATNDLTLIHWSSVKEFCPMNYLKKNAESLVFSQYI